LHLGSLFTALASFLEARSQSGQWLLRIDDVDPYRTQPGVTDRILFSLEALGLFWDGPVFYQSRQTDRYRTVLENLQSCGLVYACTCSRKKLARTLPSNQPQVYPGHCRDKGLMAVATPHALRVIVPDGAAMVFEDRIRGSITQDLAREVGDFILFRRDGAFAYHLATVLDDAEQGVTDVLRGFDLLDSTPRQLYLQQLLELPAPRYAHTPILMNADGSKLSKRTFAAEAETRHPGALLFYLLNLLNQSPPMTMQRAPANELLAWAVAHWRLERLRGIDRIAVDTGAFSA
jgi:glutamyl-Q tRNA(Asp) synthetase